MKTDSYRLLAPLLLVTSACGMFGTQTKATPEGETAQKDGQQGDYTPSAESRAWFEKCSGHYDEQMKTWKPLLDESRAAIEESKKLPFYEAVGKLSVQAQKICVDGGKLNSGGLGWHESAGVRLLVANELMERVVARGNKVGLLSGNFRNFVADEVPLTGDDDFDRATFCLAAQLKNLNLPGSTFGRLQSQPANAAHWMTPSELAAYNKKHEAVVAEFGKRLRAIDDLASAPGDDGKAYMVQGDYGKVLGVKKDGAGFSATLAHITVPYSCQHSGNWRFNGAEWTDCDYVDASPVVSYKFSARFDELPAVGLKTGDFVMFTGLVGGKVATEAKKADARWDGSFVYRIERAKKPVYASKTLGLCSEN